MPDTWIDPVADELAADIVRDQLIAELRADVAELKRQHLEMNDWRRAIYHGSKPADIVAAVRPYRRYTGESDPE